MRTLTASGAAATAAASVLFLSAPAQATADPGGNGTVRIHDGATGEELRRNDPRACAFYLDAFTLDGAQRVQWRIKPWSPTSGANGEAVKSGSLSLDVEGRGRTRELSLPNGRYELSWTFDGRPGQGQQKVFRADCGPAGEPAPSTASAAAPSPSGEGGQDTAQGGTDLAATGNGAPVAALSVAAAALVAVGGYLVTRHRQGRHG